MTIPIIAAAAQGVEFPPAVSEGAPPRWDGLVVVAEPPSSWFLGDLPASWLSARGICLDVVKRFERFEFRGHRANFGLRPQSARGAPMLFDTVSAALAPLAEKAAHRYGSRVLLSLLDDQWGAGPPRDSDAALGRFEARLREADAVIVPTARMAERVQPFAREVVIIPLALPRRTDWPARRPRRQDGGLRIGWVGTASHLCDLECLGPAVLEFLARCPSVTFVLGGGCVPSWATDHPRVEVHSGWWLMPGYYRFVASLDLDGFVCPLEDTPFNAAKPCLKPMEAAMLGSPVIASRVGAYAEELRHEETALVVENTKAAWLAALTRLVADADLRAHLAARGLDWAATQTIESTGPLWAKLWGA